MPGPWSRTVTAAYNTPLSRSGVTSGNRVAPDMREAEASSNDRSARTVTSTVPPLSEYFTALSTRLATARCRSDWTPKRVTGWADTATVTPRASARGLPISRVMIRASRSTSASMRSRARVRMMSSSFCVVAACTGTAGGQTCVDWAPYRADLRAAVPDDPDFDLYVEGREQLDFTASYDFGNGVEVFGEAKNLTDSAGVRYYGVKERTYEYEKFGYNVFVGLRFKL